MLLERQLPMPEHIKAAIFKPLRAWEQNGVPIELVCYFIFI